MSMLCMNGRSSPAGHPLRRPVAGLTLHLHWAGDCQAGHCHVAAPLLSSSAIKSRQVLCAARERPLSHSPLPSKACLHVLYSGTRRVISNGCMHPPSKAGLPVPAVGGVMVYKKKGSRDSLIASSILAGLLVMSAGLMSLAGNSYGVRLAAGEMCAATSC